VKQNITNRKKPDKENDPGIIKTGSEWKF